jgi:hypothetical protein
VARDRLPPSGDLPPSPPRAASRNEDLRETRSKPSWFLGVDEARRRDKSRRAAARLAAEARSVDSVEEKRRVRDPAGPRKRRLVILAALGVALAAIAVYGLRPDSTVREETANRTPKSGRARIDHQEKAQKSTRPTARGRRTSAPTAPRRSAVLGAVAQKSSNSGRPRAFHARVFIWPAVSGVTFYKVEFFRRGREVFEALSAKARVELPTRWVYQGRTYKLEAGTYTWQVSPGFGPRSRLRYGNPIVRSIWVAQR